LAVPTAVADNQHWLINVTELIGGYVYDQPISFQPSVKRAELPDWATSALRAEIAQSNSPEVLA
jgi:hypothetical protein